MGAAERYRGCARKLGPPVAMDAGGEVLLTALDALDCGVLIHDAGGALLFANLAARRILGRSLVRGQGPDAADLFRQAGGADGAALQPGDHPTAVALRTGTAQRDAIVDLALPDGTQRVLQVDAIPLAGAGGTARQVMTSVRDITEHRQAARDLEQARAAAEELARLRQQQAEAAEIMAAITAALAGTLDLERLYQVILQQAARLLPCDRASVVLYRDGWAVVTANWGEVTPPVGLRLFRVEGSDKPWLPTDYPGAVAVPDCDALPTWLQVPPLVGEQRTRSIVAVPLVVDGETVGYFNVQSRTPDHYHSGHLLIADALAARVMQAIRNARLYAAEQERARVAEEMARMRDDFVASVSHELRTPLSAILGFADLLLEGWARTSDDQRLDRLAKIAVAARRQKRLVEDLLLLSRVDRGGLIPKAEPVDLPELLSRAADEVRQSYGDQRIDLDGPHPLLARADADRVLQIAVNLIDNAAKYSPEGSPVAVTWAREGDTIVLRVRDVGPGIPERGREQLFTRFGRLPSSRARSGRVGTGLGLFLSRSLAVAMGGDLDLEATGPQGSTFRLRLPAA